MLSVIGLLLIAALIIAIYSAVRPTPILWIAVVLVIVVELLAHFPKG